MNPEMTEILIGKFLDSEITPAEKRLLDEELQRNPQARQLLDELQQLHEQVRQTLDSEITNCGESADVVIQRALQQEPLRVRRGRMRVPGWVHFAANLAAGFLLGFGLYHFALQRGADEGAAASSETEVAVATENGLEESNAVAREEPKKLTVPGMDYYLYPDPSGSEWLLEAYRDNDVDTASYHGDL